MVVGSIVHNQDKLLVGIFAQDMLQKGNEAIAVLASGGDIGHKASGPIISTKDVKMLRHTSARNEFTLTAFHPAASQRRMQTYGCFVHKEELGFAAGVEGDVFLSQSRISRTVSCALWSCK